MERTATRDRRRDMIYGIIHILTSFVVPGMLEQYDIQAFFVMVVVADGVVASVYLQPHGQTA